MITGFRGTFVISWAQTELDGSTTAAVTSLGVGAVWQWHGEATRVDGPADVLVLGESEETTTIRRHAAKAVRKLVISALDKPPSHPLPAPDDPLLDRGFAITDGRRSYTATIIDVPGRSVPLVMFLNDVPPEGQELWVTHVTEESLQPNRCGDAAPSVICFTPETRIATPDGPRLMRDLREDDLVLTKDDGPQPIRWIGWRRMSGARLFVMPELRPIRIRAGAIGLDVPDEDLWVSPQHRMLVKGELARALFNESEVLVSARDLLNDKTVLVDRQMPDVTYVHMLLDRHQIVFANGLETESFHPASMPLEAIDPKQAHDLLDRVPDAAEDASLYGAFVRRRLSAAEAAILRYQGFGPH